MFWGYPERRLSIVGATGTNGKTTVTNMLAGIISHFAPCGLIGTIETVAGGEHLPSERTTPHAEELFALLAKMAAAGDRYCVMEVSSHALARNRVHGLEFDVGVHTNVTRDHLDFHKTMQGYAETKAELMRQSKTAVINADDFYAPLFEERAEKSLTYAIENEADFCARDIVLSADMTEFSSPIGRVSLPAVGRFSVYNALAAIAAASALGIKSYTILDGLNAFKCVRGRMEFVPVKGDFGVCIDYAHTPDGLENVLTALRPLTHGRIITVFGCGGDRDRSKRPIMGEIAGRLSDFSVVTDDNPRTENPRQIMAEVAAGFEKNNFVCIDGRGEAIRLALAVAHKGDTVLLAGKGHETYQVIGGEKLHFDEREIIKEFENEK